MIIAMPGSQQVAAKGKKEGGKKKEEWRTVKMNEDSLAAAEDTVG